MMINSKYIFTDEEQVAKLQLEIKELENKIAELTGFGAVNTFYRNFNKQTGVTPKVYKENLKNL